IQSYPVMDMPHSISAADINGDSYVDLAIPNYSDQTVSLLLNDGDGAFANKVDLATSNSPWFATVADFNGDSHVDLAIAYYLSQQACILLNNGDATFQSEALYATGDTPNSLAVADFNGDSYPDIAATNRNGDSVSVLLNNGDGTFLPKTDYTTPNNPISVAAADLDGDAHPDMAVTSRTDDNVTILFNNGDGTFGSTSVYSTGEEPRGISAADLDGDLDNDLVIANSYSDSVGVLLNNGSGTFQGMVYYPTGDSPYSSVPYSVAVADYNGDSSPDIAAAGQYGNNVSLLLNNGNGTFQPRTDYAAGGKPRSLVASNLNGDSYPDLAVVNYETDDVTVMLNDGVSSVTGLVATADTFVSSGYPSDNFNGFYIPGDPPVDVFLVGDHVSNGHQRALLKFDLSSIPQGSTITSAEVGALMVAYWKEPDPAPAPTIQITSHRVTSGWGESTVTWNTAPTVAESYGSDYVGTTFGDYYWDVTSLVQGWLDGTYPNYGLMLKGPETGTMDMKGFTSREEAGFEPMLFVQYQLPPPPVAAFTGSPLTGPAPLEVQFTDQSTGLIDSWDWDFGDGETSTEQDPSHIYDTVDTYTVSLTATGPGGSDTETRTDYIALTPEADFAADSNSGVAPLEVQFTDQSAGDIDSWDWDFGDGGTSTVQSPSHIYNDNGIYTVSLTVTGPGGSDTEIKTDYMTVTPDAEFTGSPTSGSLPLEVQFTDQSVGTIDSWDWDFGDGGTSTEQSPLYTYNSSGVYTVALTVTGPGGSDTETRTDYITVSTEADFTADPTSGTAPLEVQFTDQSVGTIDSWDWDFGDGGTSTEQSPSHIYNDNGIYTVSLSVTGPADSDTETKTDYIAVYEVPVTEFTATPTSGVTPLEVQFTDQSTGNVVSWEWDFGDGGTSTEQNPLHTYAAGGVYTVSLTATNPAGSNTQTKVDYITAEGAPVADFSADPGCGVSPLDVQFTDLSLGDVTTWDWDFGDGGTSTEQNPSHTYVADGTYAVTLTAGNQWSTDTEIKTGYIRAGIVACVHTLSTGWNMFALPVSPQNCDFNAVLGDDVLETLYIFRYDPAVGGYQMWTAQNLLFDAELGCGYWVKVADATEIDAEGFPTGGQDRTIHLSQGWNMIGHPFNFPVDWGNVQVNYGDTTLGIVEAHDNGWVLKYLYGYNPVIGGYEMAVAPDGQLDAWHGYWVKALVECDLIIPATPLS
ncbi:PKD domain-containing protein, partial [Chloroflexota bacterium]